MCDDIYAIKPFDLQDVMTTHYHALDFKGEEDKSTSFWNHNKWKTRQLLDKENLPHMNYTTHYPKHYEFSKLKEMCDKYDMTKESYVIEDVYFNLYEHDKPILDSNIRLGIWNKKIYEEEFEKALSNQQIKFVCNSVDGWCKELFKSLEKIIR